MKRIISLLLLSFIVMNSLFAADGVETTPKHETSATKKPVEPFYPAAEAEEVTKEEGNLGGFFGELVNMFFVLGFIIAAMLIIAWVLKRLLNTRLQQMNTTSPIKILERRSLTPKSAVYLLEIHGKGIIIGETPHGITSLGEVVLPEEDQDREPPKSFGKILEDKMK